MLQKRLTKEAKELERLKKAHAKVYAANKTCFCCEQQQIHVVVCLSSVLKSCRTYLRLLQLQVGFGRVEGVHVAAFDASKGVQHQVDEGGLPGGKCLPQRLPQLLCSRHVKAGPVECLHDKVIPAKPAYPGQGEAGGMRQGPSGKLT